MADFNSAIPYIKKAEGGLSNALTDTASRKPSPFVYTGQNWQGAKYLKPNLPVHTNKGITWETFTSMAKVAGFEPNEKNFIEMPDDIWLKIYKVGYWLPMKAELYNSQAIANLIVDWAWASGVGGATRQLVKYVKSRGLNADGVVTSKDAINSLIAKEGEKKIFDELIEARKNHFKALNQPANLKGWLSRMDELKRQGDAIIVDTARKAVNFAKGNAVPVAITSVVLITTLFFLIYNRKKIINYFN